MRSALAHHDHYATAGVSAPAVPFWGRWGLGMGNALAVTTPPGAGVSGIPLVVQPVLGALGDSGLTDLLYTGTVTAAVTSGPGTVSAGATAVAVAGVVTFAGLTVTGSGTSTITFSAPGLASATANVTVT